LIVYTYSNKSKSCAKPYGEHEIIRATLEKYFQGLLGRKDMHRPRTTIVYILYLFVTEKMDICKNK